MNWKRWCGQNIRGTKMIRREVKGEKGREAENDEEPFNVQTPTNFFPFTLISLGVIKNPKLGLGRQ